MQAGLANKESVRDA
jgi:hypothetical protein